MDGAAKFNQRDAMATILITAINIVAGIVIGTIQQGVDLATAVKTYTILTVGDGLVTLIPSLLVSIAGGMILTRASSSGHLDEELGSQLLTRRNTLWIACGVMLMLALIPGMPKIAFVLMAGAVAMVARGVPATPPVAVEDVPLKKGEKGKDADPAAGGENLASLLKMDELTLEIGFQLIPLVDEKQGGQMLNRVRSLRRHLATELGFVVPPVHITDNLRLKPREYTVSLRGIEIARWQTEAGCVLAVNADPKARALPGLVVKEPAFGVAARWIQTGLENQALAAGYSVVDQTTVIGTHLGELIRKHAHELLGRQETKRLLDTMNESHPKLVEELVPKLLTLGEVQKVLQQLLREQVSIRDLGPILEVLVEAAQQSKNVVHLVESVRQSLGRGLVHPLLDNEGGLRVLTIEPNLEADLVATFDPQAALRLGDGAPRNSGDNLRKLLESVKRLTGGASTMALPVLLCPSPARYHVRRWLEPFVPKITVLAPVEIPPEIRVRSVGTLA
jgi:flagellar biosynthesis protein FlhA